MPDWKDAPEWAQWLAMDESGTWWWYVTEPWQDVNLGCWKPRDERYAKFGHTDWTDTLQHRP